LCRTCPVQGSCLAWALDAGDLHGVWGATTARERRAMAVVWRSGELGAPPQVPAPRPGDPGPIMDRRELLRLVHAR
jgi:WhiB family transcriptional regulator, redox-sensing transcriptional regulator